MTLQKRRRVWLAVRAEQPDVPSTPPRCSEEAAYNREVNLEGRVADVVVLGAGAAGLMAAIQAGRRGRRVLLLDHGDRPGRKILISGGGRCNFTNLGTRAENFVSENPHFARSALARYTPQDFLTLVERHAIPYHEKTLGQLFCNDSAKRIVTLLETECGQAGVDIRCGVQVGGVASGGASPHRFLVETSLGPIHCASVVVATGGLSIPKLGATGFGYDVARQFGLDLVEPRAALVPLVFTPGDAGTWCDLTGLSTEVVASAQKASTANRNAKQPAPAFREKLLITHRGLSGPAVLQVSSYWRQGASLTIDLAPGQEVLRPLLQQNARRDGMTLLQAVRKVLPARLADRWTQVQLHEREDWTNAGLARLEHALHHWTCTPAGSEGYAKAEVTAGGVSTQELEARTLESKRVPGLFFVGEVVDVTGWLGGYNFQWAWASGFAAGSAA